MDQSRGRPNPTPGGNTVPSGAQPNTGPTTRPQTAVQREQGTKRAKEDGGRANARNCSLFMRMARKLQRKGFVVTSSAEF